MKKQFAKVLWLTILVGVLAVPMVALALPNPTVPVSGQGVTLREVEDIIRQIAQFLIVIGVIIAVIFIIWGGIAYMMAGADETAATAAKDRIKNGVIGAAVVLGVGVILQTVAGLITRSFFQ